MSLSRLKESAPLIAAIALAVLVCLALLFHSSGASGSTAIARLSAPQWAAAETPSGFFMEPGNSNWAVAPSNGEMVYACMPHGLLPTSYANSNLALGPTAVWSSADGGHAWQAVANVPMAAFNPSLCGIVVDAVDPHIVLVSVVAAKALPGHNLSQFISTDGGAHWTTFSIPDGGGAYQLATRSGVTYARFCGQQDLLGCGANGQSYVVLAVTRGDFQHWTIISPPNPALQQNIDNFWLGPGESEVSVETQSVTSDDSDSYYLWRTTNGGKAWKQTTVPDVAYLIVQPSVSGQTARICGPMSSTQYATLTILCTTDDGQTWQRTPQFIVQPTPSPTPGIGFNGSGRYLGETDLIGITTSGDLVVSETLLANENLYWLPIDGSAWQELGILPGGVLTQAAYVGGAHAGVLWALPLRDVPNRHTAFDPSGSLFTANYPT